MDPDKINYYAISPLTYTGKTAEFTYSYHDHLVSGQIVEVTIGRRKTLGIVRRKLEKPDFKTKDITSTVDSPPIPEYLIELTEWLAGYYASSLSAVWSPLLPTGLVKKRRPTKPAKLKIANGMPKSILTKDQKKTLNFMASDTRNTQLIEGVTSSGKTRIYMELADIALKEGKSVIILVPEILLTPQLVSQFEDVFGTIVISTHSKLSESQRHIRYNSAISSFINKEPRIIVGPRSSLFLPVYNLGLIVIDECHESTYKQEQNPRYDAIVTAAQIARITGARLVLGSATPALRELKLAKDGLIGHSLMKNRTNGQPAPVASIIDLKDKALFIRSKFLTEPLIDALTQTLEANRQSLLFINRRGSASSQICGDCGKVTECPNCTLPMTFHADILRLICHHCNYRQAPIAVCSDCGGSNLRFLGGGTKRIEAEIKDLFPKANIARLDRDSSDMNNISKIYDDLKTGEIDILIGTQMITKGLDLPLIDTIGVVNADTMLQIPDYNAAEKTYQLITQVSGRAGRGDRPGRVLIQTYSPQHPAIIAATKADSDIFVNNELKEREKHQYPPYINFLKLSYSGKDRSEVIGTTDRLAKTLRPREGVEVIGPAPAFLETINNKYNWQIAIRSHRRSNLVEIARSIPDSWSIDLDPNNLL